MILTDRGRHALVNANVVPAKRSTVQGRAQPPPPPPTRSRSASIAPAVKPIYDEDLHAQPTMIIDINRVRRRR
jgi:hypothetical protein